MIDRITSRAVIGEFYRVLEQDEGAGWVNALGMYFGSDQDSEEYAWLGATPVMREWIGGRHAKGFRESGLTVKNKHFEATLEILVKHMRRDKSGQAMVRIGELADRANSHWASLLSALIINAESTVCYDGQFFFDTNHSEGDSGTQDNDIQVTIAALPTDVHGAAATAPSVGEMQQSILNGITQIAGFKDDQGEPLNELARQFVVMVPMSLFIVASKSIAVPRGTDLAEQNVPSDFSVSVVPNTRLTWTDQFAVFRSDGRVKPFIRQEEDGINLKAKAEGSEFEFDNDAHQYGIDSWREVAYGYWQHACLVKMI